MAKPLDFERCRERPPCGCVVVDRNDHRRWHERVYITAERPAPRFVGVDDEEGDEAEAPPPS